MHILLTSLLRRCVTPLAALALTLSLAGCYYEDAYYENADTDYTTVKEHNLSGDIPLKNRTLEGKIRIPSRAFTPSKVSLVFLDSSLTERDSLKGKIVSGTDTAGFKFPKKDYPYPYVKIAVRGDWHAFGKPGEKVVFETITDVSNVSEPRVDLMTHVEIPLVESLVDEGYPFAAAKKIALRKLEENFGFPFSEPILPAESYGRSAGEVGFLYALLLRSGSDSAFVENMEDFRLNLGDGLWEDDSADVELANFALDNMILLDTLVQSLVGDVQMWWKYVESTMERVFDLDNCSEHKKAVVRNDSVVCDLTRDGYYFRRLYTDMERKYGACAYLYSGIITLVFPDDSLYFGCDHGAAKYVMTEDSVLELKTWYVPEWSTAHDKFLGDCNEFYYEKKKRIRDSIYVCDVVYRTNYYWKFKNTDTLSYYMGDCNDRSIWTVGHTPDSSEYVCTFDSWKPMNDTLRFLSEQRPCDKEKDLLRSFSYDSNYYVCADVKNGGWDKVYSFRDTSKFVADSLAFIDSIPACKALADTGKIAVDTLYDKYYRCEIRSNVLKYYDTDYKHVAEYVNWEYVKTLPPCTAKSDTLEIVFNPYFERVYGQKNDVDVPHFHCSKTDSGYAYVKLSEYEERRINGLVWVNANYTCDANTDTLLVVQDSLLRNNYHCEKTGDSYGYVWIDGSTANYYKSVAAESRLKPCSGQTDTIEYQRDYYGFYFYCVENGGVYEPTRVGRESLRAMLVKEFEKKLVDWCKEEKDWGKSGTKVWMDKNDYFICDYDADSVLAYQNVSSYHYSFFNNMVNVKKEDSNFVPWEKCSDEQLAARGTPVEVQGDHITDPRDGRRYRVTTIGNQTWMAENLNYYDTLATPNMMGLSGCSDDPDACNATGRLYYWYAAMNLEPGNKDVYTSSTCSPVQGICPTGWHIPSISEWYELAWYATYHNGDMDFGGGLKTKDGWSLNPKKGDLFGFSAAPVTWTTAERAYFATSDASGSGSSVVVSYGIVFFTSAEHQEVFKAALRERSFSVRCVKD